MQIKNLLSSEKMKGVISIVAAIVMHFTPDYIDKIIETLLIAHAISVISTKEEKPNIERKKDENISK